MHAGRPIVELTPREAALLKLSGRSLHHDHLVATEDRRALTSLDHHHSGKVILKESHHHAVAEPVVGGTSVAPPARLAGSHYRRAHVEHHDDMEHLRHYEELVHLLAKHRGLSVAEAHKYLLAALGPHLHPHEAMGFWGNVWGGIKRGLGHVAGKVLEDPVGSLNTVMGLVNAVGKVA